MTKKTENSPMLAELRHVVQVHRDASTAEILGIMLNKGFPSVTKQNVCQARHIVGAAKAEKAARKPQPPAVGKVRPIRAKRRAKAASAPPLRMCLEVPAGGAHFKLTVGGRMLGTLAVNADGLTFRGANKRSDTPTGKIGWSNLEGLLSSEAFGR